jgi:hypothetical protein
MRETDLTRLKELSGIVESDQPPRAGIFYAPVYFGSAELQLRFAYKSSAWTVRAIESDDTDLEEDGTLDDLNSMVLGKFSFSTNGAGPAVVATELSRFVSSIEPDLHFDISYQRISTRPMRIG